MFGDQNLQTQLDLIATLPYLIFFLFHLDSTVVGWEVASLHLMALSKQYLSQQRLLLAGGYLCWIAMIKMNYEFSWPLQNLKQKQTFSYCKILSKQCTCPTSRF